MRFLLVLFALCCSLSYFERWSVGACWTCKWNQNNLCAALSMWAADHHGAYPESLKQLRGGFIKELPTCPASRSIPLYEATPESFTLICSGENHPGLTEANRPAYTSEDGPVGWISPAGARPRVPWMLWATFVLLIPLSHCRLRPLLLSLLLLLPAQARKQGPDRGCQSNLRNLGTALLVPNYINEIPLCPVVRHDTYSLNYRSWSYPDNFALCCTGIHHVAAFGGPNLPACTADLGIVSWDANLKNPALCEEALSQVSVALKGYRRKCGVYPRYL